MSPRPRESRPPAGSLRSAEPGSAGGVLEGTAPRPPKPDGPYVVAGLGVAGCAAAEALAARVGPASVRATDQAEGPMVLKAVRRLETAGIQTVLGGDGLDLLEGPGRPRCLVKSPGIAASAPIIAGALARGLEVIDEAELGWRVDSRPMIGVTGTNGKSTTAAVACAVVRALARRPVLAGNTRFGPPLSALGDRDGDVVVAELSSYQLEGCPTLVPDVAILTNLTEEHLERHGTLDEYVACKRRLFLRDDACVALAVLNGDDSFGRELAAEVDARGGRTVTYGREEGDYRVVDCGWTLRSGTVTLETPEGRMRLHTRLPGEHNALNLAAGAALAGALGIERGRAAAALESAEPVPGRLEVVASEPFDVVVDYAHNADGLRRALATLRTVVGTRRGARLRVVLAGLPYMTSEQLRAMGGVARSRTDHLVLTTERWSPGDSTEPLADLVAGAEERHGSRLDLAGDRRAAIEHVLRSSESGDVVAVMGRGAIDGWLFDASNRGAAFDDRVEARRCLDQLARR